MTLSIKTHSFFGGIGSLKLINLIQGGKLNNILHRITRI